MDSKGLSSIPLPQKRLTQILLHYIQLSKKYCGKMGAEVYRCWGGALAVWIVVMNGWMILIEENQKSKDSEEPFDIF
jgi:hypothetical protein